MAIYNPEIFLSRDDRELLRLLSELLIGTRPDVGDSNAPEDTSALSDAEAAKLIVLLEKLVSSRKFMEGSYFIEKLFGNIRDERQLRDIYLSWRKRLGRSRAVATAQWENLIARVGLRMSDRANENVWYRASARPMDLDHFMKMERKLAISADLHPRVQALIMEFVSARLAVIERIRKGQLHLEIGQVREPLTSLLHNLKEMHKSRVGVAPVSSSRLAAVMIIVLDFSTLFTTRDWSVAGFFSTTAGALPPAVLD